MWIPLAIAAMIMPMECRECRKITATMRKPESDPVGAAKLVSRCFDCGRGKTDHVVFEWLDSAGKLIRAE